MEVAEGQYDIGCPGLGQRATLGRKGAVFDGAEFRVVIIRLEFCKALGDAGATVFIANIRVEIGCDQCATATGKIGRDDICVPAAAGPQLDYFVIRFHPEEFERFFRVTPGVARLFGIRAVFASDRGVQRRGFGRGCLDRRGFGGGCL